MVRPSADPTDASLRDRLVSVAEVLYATHGFADVSFRQICAKAGAKNNFAVQYHFGDIEQLVVAIIDKQSMVYELRRSERLVEAVRQGPLNVRRILEILEGPIIEQVDHEGAPIGARFMVALQNTDWGWRPLSAQFQRAPVTRQLVAALEELLSHLPPPVIWQRLYLASLMIMSCAAQVPRHASKPFHDAVLENVFAMAAAALSAEIDPDAARAMTEIYQSLEVSGTAGRFQGRDV